MGTGRGYLTHLLLENRDLSWGVWLLKLGDRNAAEFYGYREEEEYSNLPACRISETVRSLLSCSRLLLGLSGGTRISLLY